MIFPKKFLTIPIQQYLESLNGTLTREPEFTMDEIEIKFHFLLFKDELQEDWEEYHVKIPLYYLDIDGIQQCRCNTLMVNLLESDDVEDKILSDFYSIINAELKLWGPLFLYATYNKADSIYFSEHYMRITSSGLVMKSIRKIEYKSRWHGFINFVDTMSQRLGYDISTALSSEPLISCTLSDSMIEVTTVSLDFKESWPPKVDYEIDKSISNPKNDWIAYRYTPSNI